MYFSQNNSMDKFELYISFLSEIIESGNDKYKILFNGIFEQVYLLANNKIDYSQVRSDIFDIVSVLAFNHKDYFKSADISKLEIEDYKYISKLLQEDIKQLIH